MNIVWIRIRVRLGPWRRGWLILRLIWEIVSCWPDPSSTWHLELTPHRASPPSLRFPWGRKQASRWLLRDTETCNIPGSRKWKWTHKVWWMEQSFSLLSFFHLIYHTCVSVYSCDIFFICYEFKLFIWRNYLFSIMDKSNSHLSNASISQRFLPCYQLKMKSLFAFRFVLPVDQLMIYMNKWTNPTW